ncbi:ATP-binding protein [Nocardiopsis sp. CC223A]|uniref:ATP-binding protein n=1 Tax=Nocardiopsis sp. CC223A TaxID=3044051 RepID=UPI00278BE52D|nr:ATP-binding protein [Nocardiopsis sp. CC223A]
MQCTASGPPAPGRTPLPRRLRGTPATSRLRIPGTRDQVAVARRWVAATAHTHHEAIRDRAVLVVSEAVTNAILHSRSGLPGGTVLVEVTRTPYLEIRVTDQGPKNPARPTVPGVLAPDPLRPSGNGMRLIDEHTAFWDWDGRVGGPITLIAAIRRT